MLADGSHKGFKLCKLLKGARSGSVTSAQELKLHVVGERQGRGARRPCVC